MLAKVVEAKGLDQENSPSTQVTTHIGLTLVGENPSPDVRKEALGLLLTVYKITGNQPIERSAE